MGLSADHRQGADAAELVYARRAGNVRPIVDADVSRQHGVVGHDHVVAQVTIVGDVGVDHQQAVVADHGGVVGHQRPMDRHVLANGIAGADHDAARPGGNVDVLGQPAEDRALEHVIVGPQGRSFLEYRVAFQNTARADRHAGFHGGEGTDLDVRADLGRGADDGRRMNAHGRYLAGKGKKGTLSTAC